MSSSFLPKWFALQHLVCFAMLGGICTSALAVPITIEANASYSLGGGLPVSVVDGPIVTSTFANVDLYGSAVASDDSDVLYHSYGDTNGRFGSRASGNGTYDISSIFLYREELTNLEKERQAYSLDFNIAPGELQVNADRLLQPGQSLYAAYAIAVQITTLAGTTTLFDSAADLTLDSSGLVFNDTGSTSLGGVLSGDDYSWYFFMDTLDLGIFASGESFTLDYYLTTVARGSVGNCASAVAPESNRDLTEPEEVEGESESASFPCGGSLARSGDPVLFGSISNHQLLRAAAVPEPGMLLLLGLGVFCIGVTRRLAR